MTRRDETRRGQGREHRRPIRVSRFCNLSGQSVDGRVGRVDGQIVETVSKRLGQFPAFPRQFTILTDVQS